jgi:hypothetical protein
MHSSWGESEAPAGPVTEAPASASKPAAATKVALNLIVGSSGGCLGVALCSWVDCEREDGEGRRKELEGQEFRFGARGESVF